MEGGFGNSLTGSFLMVKACFSHMKEQRWGRIVNVSSEIALYGMNKASHYAAAKSGLHGFTRSIAKELGPYGILSNVVAPWLIMTERFKETLPQEAKDATARVNPLGGAPEAEDVARTILFLGSAWNTYVNGEIIAVDGGAHALPS
jgi:NAD(P)-dependent dehydrogenase (short-subunit alcohol dehydrogenase family)